MYFWGVMTAFDQHFTYESRHKKLHAQYHHREHYVEPRIICYQYSRLSHIQQALPYTAGIVYASLCMPH